MTHLQKLKSIQYIEHEHNKQKEILLQQITNINTLYSKYNGDFLKELSNFIETYENRRKIKLGQLYDEISSELATKNEENSGISSIVSDIPRTQEAI